jgi:hypothetical protein
VATSRTILNIGTWVAGLWMLALASVGRGQEFYVQMGGNYDLHSRQSSYTWQFDFRRPIADGLDLSFGWLNEGHFPDHHRDGFTGQLWGRFFSTQRRFSLWGGLGFYHYYDTTSDSAGGYLNNHGLRPVISLQARKRLGRSSWEFLATVYSATRGDAPRTFGLLGGFSFHPLRDGSDLSSVNSTVLYDRYQEVMVYSGTTIQNSFNSETARNFMVEYRDAFWPHGAWSVSLISEGDTTQMRREGLAAQFWLTRAFAGRHVELEMAAGPYFTRVVLMDAEPSRIVWTTSAKITVGAGFRIDNELCLRLHWNRILTSYNRDTDVLDVGLGYSW